MNKEQTKEQEDYLEFIRDACSAYPKPKSEMKRRLNKILVEVDKGARKEIINDLLDNGVEDEKVTTVQAVCDDSECMIRKQNIKGFNSANKKWRELIQSKK